MKWPIFKNYDQLHKSSWSNYFILLYGSIPSDNNNYPIDLSTFWIFYTDLLDQSNIKLDAVCDISDTNCANLCSKLCPSKDGSIYTDMSRCCDIDKTVWIYHKGPYQRLPDNTKVEVTHCIKGFKLQQDMETVGSWMYYAKGSGVYFDIGKSIF